MRYGASGVTTLEALKEQYQNSAAVEEYLSARGLVQSGEIVFFPTIQGQNPYGPDPNGERIWYAIENYPAYAIVGEAVENPPPPVPDGTKTVTYEDKYVIVIPDDQVPPVRHYPDTTKKVPTGTYTVKYSDGSVVNNHPSPPPEVGSPRS